MMKNQSFHFIMARDVIFRGLGVGIVFWGVRTTQPLTLHSPPKDVKSIDRRRVAFFHWGYHNGQSSLWSDLSWHISNLERSEMV